MTRRRRSDAGYGYLILGVIFLAALDWLIKFVETNQDDTRRQDLRLRYGDLDVVDAIMGKKVKIGMTRDQLIESWGHQQDIKQTILKTRRKEEFKYTNVQRYWSDLKPIMWR